MFQCQGKEAHVSIFKSRFCTVIDVFLGVFFSFTVWFENNICLRTLSAQQVTRALK